MAAIRFVNRDSVYDFGLIKKGDEPRYQFDIENTGNAPLTITGMSCNNASIKFEWTKKAVKPGKKGRIYVAYLLKDTTAPGSFKCDVLVTSNATQQPYPFIHLSGAVVPARDGSMPEKKQEDGVMIKTGNELFYGDPPVK